MTTTMKTSTRLGRQEEENVVVMVVMVVVRRRRRRGRRRRMVVHYSVDGGTRAHAGGRAHALAQHARQADMRATPTPETSTPFECVVGLLLSPLSPSGVCCDWVIWQEGKQKHSTSHTLSQRTPNAYKHRATRDDELMDPLLHSRE
jgi:hypothetical protein